MGWYFFLEAKNGKWRSLFPLTNIFPVGEEIRVDMKALLSIADFVLRKDDRVRTYLVLFQNNYELRPGGGFIGSFGVLKIRSGELIDFAVHDTGNFDGRIPSTVDPPYPLRETLRVDSWKFRDSNFSPDFPTNAAQAQTFYSMGGGGEQFDGIVGITTDVLVSLLSVTGPVAVPGFPGTYGGESAVWDLEYQVEQGFLKQGIERGERKTMMNDLGWQVLDRIRALNVSDKWKLFEVVLADLHQKDIQLYFNDAEVANKIRLSGWGGEVNQFFPSDTLIPVDANMGSFKSDYFVKRSYDYVVNLSQEKPTARFSITYRHGAEKADWRVKEYQTFFRLYVPNESWLNTVSGAASQPVFGKELGRRYFGVIAHVPLGGEKTVSFDYTLPDSIRKNPYFLDIGKQAGIHDTPVSVTIIHADGTNTMRQFVLNRDVMIDVNGDIIER